MRLTAICFFKKHTGGRQEHVFRFTKTVKARKKRQLARVRSVEEFLRPYKLNRWGATKWEIEHQLRQKAATEQE